MVKGGQSDGQSMKRIKKLKCCNLIYLHKFSAIYALFTCNNASLEGLEAQIDESGEFTAERLSESSDG